jgi:hypothetical protein
MYRPLYSTCGPIVVAITPRFEPGEARGPRLAVDIRFEGKAQLPLHDGLAVPVLIAHGPVDLGQCPRFIAEARIPGPSLDPADQDPSALLVHPPRPLLEIPDRERLHVVPGGEREYLVLVPIGLLLERSPAALEFGEEPGRVPEVLLGRDNGRVPVIRRITFMGRLGSRRFSGQKKIRGC